MPPRPSGRMISYCAIRLPAGSRSSADVVAPAGACGPGDPGASGASGLERAGEGAWTVAACRLLDAGFVAFCGSRIGRDICTGGFWRARRASRARQDLQSMVQVSIWALFLKALARWRRRCHARWPGYVRTCPGMSGHADARGCAGTCADGGCGPLARLLLEWMRA